MPSSYSNDLRIEEQATGENSATWGTKLNSAISQISDAFSYGTEQLSADANETFTIADGTADAARSLYLKITSAGSLTATRTVTLGPNTVSKIWIIENATTGSQSIAISQGSGANVTVASGATKVVYTDGAGAGAAVTDALVNLALTAPTLTGTAVVASLDISGDIDVDGTTNLDVVDIDGAVDMASTLAVGGTTTITGTDDTPLLINTANTNGPHLRFQVSGSSKHFVGSGGGIALGDADDLAVRAFDNLLFSTGNSSTERFRIDASGRVGVGGAPNGSWRNDSTDDVLMLGSEATLHSDAGVTTELWNNALVNNDDTFVNISGGRGATRYFQYNGEHKWYTAASASAGSTITSEIQTTPKMTLDVTGKVHIGTSGVALLNVNAADGVMDEQYVARFANNEATAGRNYGVFVAGGSNSSDESFSVRPYTNTSTLYLKVRGDGNVGIGGDPSNKLEIRGASTVGTINGHIMLTGDSATTGQGPQIVFSESGNSSNWVGASIGFERTGGSGIGNLLIGTRATAGDANTVATTALTISSTQKASFTAHVGIGDSNPGYPLSIQADGIAMRLDGTDNTTRSIFFRNTTTGNPAQIYSDGSLKFFTEDADTTIGFMSASTKVGVGTMSPAAAKFSGSATGLLNVYGTMPVVAVTESDVSDSEIYMGMTGGTGYIGKSGAGSLILSTGATSTATALTLDNSQNATFAGDVAVDKYLRLRTTDDQANQWYLYSHTDDTLRINYNGAGADAIIIDTSENVGIGGSPEARLHIENASSGTSIAADAGDVLIVENSSSAMVDIRSPAANAGGILFSDPDARARGAIYYYHNDGLDSMYFNTAGSSGQMIINSSGNVGIGTDPGLTRFNVLQDAANWTGIFKNTNSNAYGLSIDLASSSGAGGQADIYALACYTPVGTGFFVLKGGVTCVGTSSAAGSGASSGKQIIQFSGATENGLYLDDTRTASGTDNAVIFGRGSTYVGKIETTTAPATNYVSASDARLKENISDAADAGSKIDQIQVRQFDWKGDNSHQAYGLIAQELESIAPNAVSTPAGADEMLGIDPGKLVPMLIKEIQSLRSRVSALENN